MHVPMCDRLCSQCGDGNRSVCVVQCASPSVCVRSEGEPVKVSMCDCLLVRADVVVLVNTQL